MNRAHGKDWRWMSISVGPDAPSKYWVGQGLLILEESSSSISNTTLEDPCQPL